MTASPPVPLSVGDVLGGKYRITRLLGRGGMGAVFAAEHTILKQEVAIKLLVEGPGQATLVQRFVNEARAAARIQGEHVVRVFDVDTLPDGNLFIAMELLQGEDLDTLLERTRTLEPTVAVDYVLQAMEALAQAHQLGVVHRDLKPSNLFLVTRPDGEHVIKVLDFGIAKVASLPNVEQASTQTSALFGTPLYMSPEQIRSAKNADAQSDLWSLGVILFRMLTGELPFAGETFGALCFAIAEQTPPAVHTLRSEISPSLSHVIACCLERDKEKRFKTAGELAAALRPFASHDGARSADRVLATGRGLSISQAPQPSATTSAPAVATPPAPTAANFTASQARSVAPRSRRAAVAVGLTAGVLVLAIGAGVVRHLRARPVPASSAVSAAAPNVEPEAASTAAAPSPKPPEQPTQTATPAAAPSADASVRAPAKAVAHPTLTARHEAARVKPRHPAARPVHAKATHPASSASGIVTNMGWN